MALVTEITGSHSATNETSEEAVVSASSKREETESIVNFRSPNRVRPWPKLVSDIHELRHKVYGAKHILSRMDVCVNLASGFQPVQTYKLYRCPPLISVLTIPYIPGRVGEIVLGISDKNVHFFHQGGGKETAPLAAGGFHGLVGVSRWVYLTDYKIYIVATTGMEIKVLNNIFQDLQVILSEKPILHLNWIKEERLLVLGAIGYADVYRLNECQLTHQRRINLEPTMWVHTSAYEKRNRELYIPCDSSIRVYTLDGQHKDTMTKVHNGSITLIRFYPPLGYIVIGGKDCSVSVFSSSKGLVSRFVFSGEPTGIEFMESIAQEEKGTLPVVLVSFKNGFIRLLSLESGTVLYSYYVHSQCLGLQMSKKDHFMYFTPDSVEILYINRYQNLFTLVSAPTKILKRYDCPGKVSRLLAVTVSGAVYLISPVSGRVLGLGYNQVGNDEVVEAMYDMDLNRIRLFTKQGFMVDYSAEENPFRIISVASLSSRHMDVVCICQAFIGQDITFSNEYNTLEEYFEQDNDPEVCQLLPHSNIVFAGASTGHILALSDYSSRPIYSATYLNHYKNSGHHEEEDEEPSKHVLEHGHASKVEMLKYDPVHKLLLTAGENHSIRVWTVIFNKPKPDHSLASAIKLKLWWAINLDSSYALPSQIMMLNPDAYEISIQHNNDLRIVHYGQRAHIDPPSPHEVVNESSNPIKCIEYLPLMQLWATLDVNGHLKVWRHGTVLRELKFNEQALSFHFLNQRGDLIVGLSDQITLVRAQDYLPLAVLLQLEQLGPIAEDVEEEDILFNETLDFWEIYKDDIMDKEGPSFKWHCEREFSEFKADDSPRINQVLDNLIAKTAIKDSHRAVKDQDLDSTKLLQHPISIQELTFTHPQEDDPGEEDQMSDPNGFVPQNSSFYDLNATPTVANDNLQTETKFSILGTDTNNGFTATNVAQITKSPSKNHGVLHHLKHRFQALREAFRKHYYPAPNSKFLACLEEPASLIKGKKKPKVDDIPVPEYVVPIRAPRISEKKQEEGEDTVLVTIAPNTRKSPSSKPKGASKQSLNVNRASSANLAGTKRVDLTAEIHSSAKEIQGQNSFLASPSQSVLDVSSMEMDAKARKSRFERRRRSSAATNFSPMPPILSSSRADNKNKEAGKKKSMSIADHVNRPHRLSMGAVQRFASQEVDLSQKRSGRRQSELNSPKVKEKSIDMAMASPVNRLTMDDGLKLAGAKYMLDPSDSVFSFDNPGTSGGRTSGIKKGLSKKVTRSQELPPPNSDGFGLSVSAAYRYRRRTMIELPSRQMSKSNLDGSKVDQEQGSDKEFPFAPKTSQITNLMDLLNQEKEHLNLSGPDSVNEVGLFYAYSEHQSSDFNHASADLRESSTMSNYESIMMEDDHSTFDMDEQPSQSPAHNSSSLELKTETRPQSAQNSHLLTEGKESSITERLQNANASTLETNFQLKIPLPPPIRKVNVSERLKEAAKMLANQASNIMQTVLPKFEDELDSEEFRKKAYADTLVKLLGMSKDLSEEITESPTISAIPATSISRRSSTASIEPETFLIRRKSLDFSRRGSQASTFAESNLFTRRKSLEFKTRRSSVQSILTEPPIAEFMIPQLLVNNEIDALQSGTISASGTARTSKMSLKSSHANSTRATTAGTTISAVRTIRILAAEQIVGDDNQIPIPEFVYKIERESAFKYLWEFIKFHCSDRRTHFTLMTLYEFLMYKFQTGSIKVKCDSCRALLYFYLSYRQELFQLNTMEHFVLPQLEVLPASSWEVRAYILAHIMGYRVYHPDLLFTFICSLRDKNNSVEKLARLCLGACGIHRKSALKDAMISIGLLEEDKINVPMSDGSTPYLETLLKQAREQANEAVKYLPTIQEMGRWVEEQLKIGVVTRDFKFSHGCYPFKGEDDDDGIFPGGLRPRSTRRPRTVHQTETHGSLNASRPPTSSRPWTAVVVQKSRYSTPMQSAPQPPRTSTRGGHTRPGSSSAIDYAIKGIRPLTAASAFVKAKRLPLKREGAQSAREKMAARTA